MAPIIKILPFRASWANDPILLTEKLSDPVWDDAGIMKIPGGYLWVKNDAHFLYAALDLVDDTGNDPGTGDYFWFTFDINRNGNINPNVDTNYGLYPGQPEKMGRQYYLGPGTWTGLLNEVSQSKCKIAFEASPKSAASHRIWKLRFSLPEINVSLIPFLATPYVKFGLRVSSSSPGFTHNTPDMFFTTFANLHTLYLSRKPVMVSADLGPVIGSVGLIPTTKINDVTGRATTAANYYTAVDNAAFGGVLNILGNRAQLQALWAAPKSARKYKIHHRPGTSGTFNELRASWYNYRWNGSDYVLEPYGPDAANFYQVPDPGVDYSIDDLLIQLNTGLFAKGIHQFKVTFYKNDAASTPVPTVVPEQILTLSIDNTVPVVKLNSIKHNGADVDACAIVKMTSDTDGLVFNIDAHDPEGNLLSYALSAGWGNGESETIESGKYNPTAAETAAGILNTPGTGVQNRTIPPSGVWIPEVSCAHAFTVSATARVTNGYGYIGYNSVSKYITILKSTPVATPFKTILAKGIQL